MLTIDPWKAKNGGQLNQTATTGKSTVVSAMWLV